MEPVLHSFKYSIVFISEQVNDVADADMSVQPKGLVNHPAWVIGHLTFVCQMLGGVIGLSPWLPGNWAERFGPGSLPIVDAALYEPKCNALGILRDAHDRISSAVSGLKESQLDAAFPDQAYLEIFPTVRHALTQVLVGHTAFHVGQLSVWRRAMGLPTMHRSYE